MPHVRTATGGIQRNKLVGPFGTANSPLKTPEPIVGSDGRKRVSSKETATCPPHYFGGYFSRGGVKLRVLRYFYIAKVAMAH